MKLRRHRVPIQLEMTPLIDVVFLLLTFFIFALVLMVRADVLDIRLPRVGSGTPASRAEAVLVSLRADGVVVVNGETVEADRAGDRVRALLEGREGTTVLLSADERAPAGLLIELADRLVAAGVREFSIAGTPGQGENPRRRANPGTPSPEE
jgi:biopolymer transport protein ExbD